MKDLIQRLEKFEADWNQLKNLQPDVLLSLFGNQRKRSRKPQNGHKPRMANGPKANFMESYEYSHSPVQITDEIQIEEIVPCESSPPPPKMKKDNPIEIEVKVSDPAFPAPVKPVQVTPTGSSRRKGASQVRAIQNLLKTIPVQTQFKPNPNPIQTQSNPHPNSIQTQSKRNPSSILTQSEPNPNGRIITLISSESPP